MGIVAFIRTTRTFDPLLGWQIIRDRDWDHFHTRLIGHAATPFMLVIFDIPTVDMPCGKTHFPTSTATFTSWFGRVEKLPKQRLRTAIIEEICLLQIGFETLQIFACCFPTYCWVDYWQHFFNFSNNRQVFGTKIDLWIAKIRTTRTNPCLLAGVGVKRSHDGTLVGTKAGMPISTTLPPFRFCHQFWNIVNWNCFL